MRESLKSMKISFILAAILYIVLGLVLILWPSVTMNLICYAFGALLAIYGLITIISYFVHDSKQGSFVLELFVGIAAAAVGILFLVKPGIVEAILPVAMGIFIIVDSLLNLKRALELRRMGYERWLVTLILSLVSAALGLLICFRPYMTAKVLTIIIGVVFLYNGLSDLWTLFKLSRVTKEYRKRVPIEVDPIDLE